VHVFIVTHRSALAASPSLLESEVRSLSDNVAAYLVSAAGQSFTQIQVLGSEPDLLLKCDIQKERVEAPASGKWRGLQPVSTTLTGDMVALGMNVDSSSLK
jgi:hypothetical protein